MCQIVRFLFLFFFFLFPIRSPVSPVTLPFLPLHSRSPEHWTVTKTYRHVVYYNNIQYKKRINLHVSFWIKRLCRDRFIRFFFQNGRLNIIYYNKQYYTRIVHVVIATRWTIIIIIIMVICLWPTWLLKENMRRKKRRIKKKTRLNYGDIE